MGNYDAVIIGSGPNGLAAAIRLALEGLSVKVFEAADTIGGGMRTKELIRPGFHHDVCSAIHPLGIASPFLKKIPLDQHGLQWIHPKYPAAHPMEDEPAVLLTGNMSETAFLLGKDEHTYKSIVSPIVNHWDKLTKDFLGPLSIPRHPIHLASFGIKALQPAHILKNRFNTHRAKALFAGLVAHSMLPLDSIATSALGLVFFGAAHTGGWPMPKGGSQSIANSMGSYLKSLGGQIETGYHVYDLKQLPSSKAILFDLSPDQIITICGDRIPASYKRRISRYKFGMGAFKVDYILSEPVPWKDSECRKAGTVHLGGTFDEIARSEKETDQGGHPSNPFVLISQQSLFDQSRTLDNKQTLWAYCHTPNGSTVDMTNAIESQIERFAPGFKDIIEDKVTMNTKDLHNYNQNYVGGDINGGRQDITQLFARPVSFYRPYALPFKGGYICSASTPPGGGVHGMCGYHAASLALKAEFGKTPADWKFRL